MQRLVALIVEEARGKWSVSDKLSILLLFGPLLVLLTAALIRQLDRPNWSAYWAEGGPAEWLQFCMLLIAVAFCVLIVRELLERKPFLAIVYAVLAAGLFFVAGEEAAWGQTVFEFSTPTALLESNYKGEMSMHNISALVSAFDFGKLMIGIYGAFAAWGMLWLRARGAATALEVLAPPLFLGSWFLVVVVQRIGRLTLLRESVPVGYGEFEELCLYFGLMAYTGLVWRRLRLERVDQHTASSVRPG